MNKFFSNRKGFTLVELLVVIAIIAILSALIFGSLYSSRSKARDAKRISDIAQIQLALEQYFDKCRKYPADNDGNLTTGSLAAGCVILGTYISVIPTAPSPGIYFYSAKSDGYDYVLKATFENNNEALKDSLPTFAVSPTGFVPAITCNNNPGAGSYEYCVGPK
jgi:prepilin-type N-terminal cleavage/methylation domain-containing protein